MTRRYILAPEAARDLVAIWRYIKKESREETADRVGSVIRNRYWRLPNHLAWDIAGRT